jgi:hypothetical protein
MDSLLGDHVEMLGPGQESKISRRCLLEDCMLELVLSCEALGGIRNSSGYLVLHTL